MEYLKTQIITDYGLDTYEEVLNAFQKSKPLTLRTNTTKSTKDKIIDELKNQNISFENPTWYEDAFIITGEEDIRSLSIYQNGEIYVQNLSSMLPPLILDPQEKETILDMAAAPGGKTLEMYNLSNGKALITACERNKSRLERLKYNIEKQGAKRISLINKDARELDEFFKFDKILLDAPCSGSGTLSPKDNHEISEDLLKKTTKLQKDMLEKAVKLLKVNGTLVYSTCSILKEENENIIKPYIEQNILQVIKIDEEKYKDVPKLQAHISGSLCVKPSELYEGFFVIKLKKL